MVPQVAPSQSRLAEGLPIRARAATSAPGHDPAMRRRTQVLIVGAGPAGLVVAWLLHRAGVGTVVVERERREDLGTRPKAGLVEYRTVELLRREGLAARTDTGGDGLPADADAVLAFGATNGRTEFRTPDESVVLDYAAITGDRPHFVYPQHRIVDELATALAEAGATLLFGHAVEHLDPDAATVTLRGPDGTTTEIEADVVVGADGAGSRVARAIAGRLTVHEHDHPRRWLVITAGTGPLADHTIYAAHPRGYAAHLRRTPEVTRFYLEVAAGEAAAAWPHDRLRAELAARLGVGDALDGVPIHDVDTLDLRVRVTEPMQHGRCFLVGDAAHLITPAGGKGMNLAVGDAVELAHGLLERFGAAAGTAAPDGSRLEAYSATRLPVIWRTHAFSDWLLRILSSPVVDADGFAQGVRGGWVSALQHDPLLARWFAFSYAGVDDPV